jgi:hypothetical protein
MNSVKGLPKEVVYYFASPYTSPDPYIRERRYLDVIKVATDLIHQGYTLLEPIAMSHHHAQRFGLPSGYEFWKKRDRTFIEISDGVLVCMLDGWQESIGVTDEIHYAKSLGKPVFYLNPDTLALENVEDCSCEPS